MTAQVPALVSTVIPVWNGPRLVARAIDSVLAQDYRPIEVIVVDDGSDDDTAQVLQAMRGRHPAEIVVVVHEQAAGPGQARESGRARVRGEYVQYLDSDDVLAADKFRRQVAEFEADPTLDVVYGDVEEAWTDEHGVVRSEFKRLPSMERGFPSLLEAPPWHTFVPLYRRSVVDRAGPWLPLWNEEDWEYDGRIAALGARLAKVEGVVGTMHRSPTGHLSGGVPSARSLASCARARPQLLEHAILAGVPCESAAFQSAVRSMFHLARQCGAMGLAPESRALLRRVQEWSRPACPRDVRAYRWIARVLGTRAAGRLGQALDALRARRSV